MSITFIVGCARSGTTSLLRAIELGGGAACLSEPMPNLNHESRAKLDGRLARPIELLARTVAPRVGAGLDRRRHYVEKQVSLVPFMLELAALLDCRFVIPIRDGRDVVRSLINWHDRMFPIVYQECRDTPDLSAQARAVLERQQGEDPFNVSLPRPRPGDPAFEGWASFSRFEMTAWYWAFINRLIHEQCEQLDPSRWLVVDYTSPTPDTIRAVYDFIGLPGYDAGAVESLLENRVNSLEERAGETGSFPRWPAWSPEQTQRFHDLAFDTMRQLGFEERPVRPRPPGFGDWWSDEQNDVAWYEQIFRYREPLHDLFKAWSAATERRRGAWTSVVEIGCGIGLGYADFYDTIPFTGIDLSPWAIDYCTQHNTAPGHRWLCCDILDDPPDVQADLVFSQGTIDNVYDIDAFVRAMARMTRGVLYLLNYRGYFKGLREHRYAWDPGTRVCFNDISPQRIDAVLRAEGFETIVIFPQATHRGDIACETAVIASREAVDPDELMAGHEIHFAFDDYRVEDSGLAAPAVLDAVNAGCAYFSLDLDLANPPAYFDRMLLDLSRLDRNVGTMAELADPAAAANLGIRVDVDMDLAAALEMAAIGRRRRVPMSFYVLHTAPYYGHVAGGVFQRNTAAASHYRALQDAGAEVGLHVDALHLYLDHDIDGAQAVERELAWLRSEGLTITGTSGHNAAPVYGAENFEIFAGRVVRPRPFAVRDFTYIPLGRLDERALGLDYEAARATPAPAFCPEHPYLRGLPTGDFLRDPHWLRTYLLDNPYCRWGYDCNAWLIGRDLWAVARRSRALDAAGAGAGAFQFGLRWDAVRNLLAACDPDERVCLTLHPIYLGRRERAGAPPMRE